MTFSMTRLACSAAGALALGSLHFTTLAATPAAAAPTKPTAASARPAVPSVKPAARPAARGARKTAAAAPVAPPPPPEADEEQLAAAEKVYYGVYECEFKQSVEIVTSTRHKGYVDVRHLKSVWLMKPVLSSTGAIRLEDVRGETLMVQISSKSMLLNVKSGHRIVDDCVSARQRELIDAARARAAQAATAPAAASAASAVGAGSAVDAAVPSGPASAPPASSAAPAASDAASSAPMPAASAR